MVSPQQSRNRLPTPARDRRGLLAVLAVLLIVVGALSAAIVVYRTGNRVDVLVASHAIPAGQKVSANDFTTTRVASDGANVVDADAEANFIGSYATTSIPSGTLINAQMFRIKQVVPADSVVLGVTLSIDQRPAKQIAPGDIVRVFYGPHSNGSTTGTGTTTGSTGSSTAPQLPVGYVIVSSARVVDVVVGATSSSGTVSVSLLLTTADAQALVPYATADSVAIGELPVDTHLSIDYATN